MKTTLSQGPKATSYGIEARNRMRYVMNYLEDVQTGKWSAVVVPLWNLWALEDRARESGYDGITQLCREMEKRLRELLPGQGDGATGRDLDVLVRVGQFIIDHAALVEMGEAAPVLPEALALSLGMSVPHDETVQKNACVYDAHGVVATLSGDKICVQLPHLTSVRHQWQVVSALRSIQRTVSPDLHWEVDASAVGDLAVPVVNALVTLTRDVRYQEREFVVTGFESHWLESFPICEPAKLCAAGEAIVPQMAIFGVDSGLVICEV